MNHFGLGLILLPQVSNLCVNMSDTQVDLNGSEHTKYCLSKQDFKKSAACENDLCHQILFVF